MNSKETLYVSTAEPEAVEFYHVSCDRMQPIYGTQSWEMSKYSVWRACLACLASLKYMSTAFFRQSDCVPTSYKQYPVVHVNATLF
jgi:hypothetical protein